MNDKLLTIGLDIPEDVWTTVYSSPENGQKADFSVLDDIIVEGSKDITSTDWPQIKSTTKQDLIQYNAASVPWSTNVPFKIMFNPVNIEEYPWNKPNIMKPETDVEESPQKIVKDLDVPKSILDLVPDSVPEDWHRHTHNNKAIQYGSYTGNTLGKTGGWVYKNATVHKSAVISLDSVVYDNAVIGEDVQILDRSKVYGNAKILKGFIHQDSEASGDVVMDAVSGLKPHIYEYSKVSGNVQIFDAGIIRSNSKVSGNVLLKNWTKIVSSTVSGDIRLLDTSYINGGIVSGRVTLFGQAGINGCTFVGNNFIALTGCTYSQSDASGIQLKSYRTQKARGVLVLTTFKLLEKCLYDILDINSVKPGHLHNRFVRPCPKTPRHGFVDSRYITDETEAAKIIEETRQADPDAEIISMVRFTPAYSGVWTEGKLTIGPGNDGATSGKDTITIPIAGSVIAPEKFSIMCELAGITDSAYIELLWNNTDISHNGNYNKIYTPVYVQLRDGPKLPITTDFIPEEFVVKSIVLAEGSLLEWEEKVKTFEPGTVVYHPGGSLSSHYSVHCVLNKIPVLISKKPKVGEKVRPSSNQNFILDPEKVKQGFVYSLTDNISYMLATYAMLVGCHSISEWVGKEDFLLGFCLGCAFRLTVIAGIAEYRHYNKIKTLSKERSLVYDDLWEKTALFKTRHMFLEALAEFKKGNKPGAGGIGGIKWYDYGVHALNIINYLISNDILKAFEVMNTLINAVHNGGWGFNKFADASTLDDAASSPAIIMMKVAPAFYKAKQSVQKMDTTAVQNLSRFFVNRRKWEIGMSKSISQPDTDICGCEEHECTICYPLGCSCKKKICHDCGLCDKCCECGRCTCKKCKPEGCKCKNKLCHDCNNCISCCGCKKHDCIKCFPWSCGCKSKKCHDCKQPDCNFCVIKSKITEVQVKIVGQTALIHYKRQGMAGYKSLQKPLPAVNLDLVKKWVTEHSTSPSWAGSKMVMYAPLAFNGTTWMLNGFEVALPFPLGSCGCNSHHCGICYPKGTCPCINKYCHDCKCHDCPNCFPDGCPCKCKECHKEPCKCNECCCGSHNCGLCYPNGCDCSCEDCHDKGCKSCCDCGDHDCDLCYSDGCPCNCSTCHDDGCEDCITPDEPEENEDF
jgi:hypothetical protein